MTLKEDNTPKDIQADVEAIAKIGIASSLLEVVCRTTGMGFAAIARVTDKQWVACKVHDEISFGLTPGDELALETTICNEIRQSHQLVAIDHVAEDDHFRCHHTPLQYGFQSYISVPILRKDGSFFGTLCAIDPRPAKINNPGTIGMFTLFADLISFHLDVADNLSVLEAKLEKEHESKQLREQFIAILGHDLRNPLGTVLLGADILLGSSLNEEQTKLVRTIKNSGTRMKTLIHNVLDLARTDRGEKLNLNFENTHRLQNKLKDVVAELNILFPSSEIISHIDINVPVYCDADRIAQLFANIASNAIAHGDENMPIAIESFCDNDNFSLSVSNRGQKVPDALLANLFKPYYRGDDKTGKNGLGLGLYIAHEIADAHNGTLAMTSNEEETCATFTMPLSTEELPVA